MFDHTDTRLLQEILEELKRSNATAVGETALLQVVAAEQIASKQLLQQLVDNTQPQPVYTVRLTQLSENNMALGTISPGSTGQFGAVLLNNGVPDTSSFVPTFTWTSSDASATFAPATTDASGGTIPLANQIVMSIPTGDTSSSASAVASTPDPTGATQSGSVTVAVTGTTTAVYSVGVTQLA
jgi:hypothetical protein